MRRRACLAGMLLAAGCSLPLPTGVHRPTAVPGQGQPAELQVLPQGPTAGLSPAAAVAGFLAAQASPTGSYAIARQFLTGAAARAWSPEAGISVYSPDTERVALAPQRQGETSVQVQLTVLGEVDQDGHFVPERRDASDFYGVTKTREGWRVSTVPKGVGLQLTKIDLLRTFAARNIYYLAPQLPGTGQARHLVPDRVFLPSGPGTDVPTDLVRRVFAQPSPALKGAVDEVLPGVAPLSATRSRDGVVTVTLSEDANGLGADDLRDLSARLVWTLRADPLFTGLRLTTTRGILRPRGSSDVQPASAWSGYDPEGLGADPAYFFVARHRLRASGLKLPASAFTQPAPAGTAVDTVAVSPRGDRIATLHAVGGQVEVDLGSSRSSTVTVGLRAAGLSSPTWGSGEAGLWLIQGHQRVMRLDGSGKHLTPVAIQDRPAGRLTSLALSRDGARAALVIDRKVYVAKVVWHAGVATLSGAVKLLSGPGSPSQVVWSTPTELVVLQPDQGATAVLRLAVDGSSSTTVLTGQLMPTAVAAAGPVLVLASRGALYSVAQGITKETTGSQPTFPG